MRDEEDLGYSLDDVLGSAVGRRPVRARGDRPPTNRQAALEGITLDDVMAGLPSLYAERPKENAPGFMTAAANQLGGMLESMGQYSVVSGGEPRTGGPRMLRAVDSAQRWMSEEGREMQERNPTAINSLSDARKDYGLTVTESLGAMAPSMVQSAALAAIGTAIAPGIGTVGLPLLAGYIQSTGGIQKAQKEAGIQNDAVAHGAGAAIGAMERIVGLDAVAGKFGRSAASAFTKDATEKAIAKQGTDALRRESGDLLSRQTLKNFGKQAGIGMATEGPTEWLQTGIENWAGKTADPFSGEETWNTLSSDENLSEMNIAGLKGMIGGGGVRGGMSLVAGSKQDANTIGDKTLGTTTDPNDPGSEGAAINGSFVGPLDPNNPAGNTGVTAPLTQEEIAKNNAAEAAKAAALNQQQANQAGAVNQQQANQAAANQQQQQAVQQSAQQLFTQFGIRPTMDAAGQPSGKFTLGQISFPNHASALQFAQKLTDAGKDLPPAQQTLVGQILSIPDNLKAVERVQGTDAKKIVKASVKFLEKAGLSNVPSVEAAVSQLDDIFEASGGAVDLYSQTKNSTADFILDLDYLYKALTGAQSARLEQKQEERMALQQQKEKEKAAAKVTATASKPQKGTGEAKPAANTSATVPASQAPSEVTSVPLDQYLVEQQTKETGAKNGQQQQTTSGVGEVSVTPGTAGVPANGPGDVRPDGNESVGAGTQPTVQNGEQDDTGGSARDGQRAADSTTTGDTDSASGQASQEVADSQGRLTASGKVIGKKYRAPRAGESNGNQTTDGQSAGVSDSGATSTARSSTSTTGSTDGDSSETSVDRPAGGLARDAETQDSRGTEDTGYGNESSQEQVEAEIAEEAAQSRSFARRILEAAFRIAAPSETNLDKKVEFFLKYFGATASDRTETLKEIAAEYGIELSQAKRWSAQLDNYAAAFRTPLEKALTQVAKAEGLTVEQAGKKFGDSIRTRQWADDIEQMSERSEIETDIFDADQDRVMTVGGKQMTAKEASIREAVGTEEEDGQLEILDGKTSKGMEERGAAGGKESNAYLKWTQKGEALQAELEKAQDEGDFEAEEATQAKIDAHEAKLPKILEQVTTAAKKGAKQNLSGRVSIAEQLEADLAGARGDLDALRRAGTDEGAIFEQTAEVERLEQEIAQARDSSEEASTDKPADKPAAKKTRGRAPKKEATTTEKKAEPVLQTHENAGAAWDKVMAPLGDAGMPWSALTEEQQDTFYEFGPKNWTRADVMGHAQKIAPQLSTDEDGNISGERETVESATAAIKSFIGGLNNSRLVIVENVEQLPEAIRNHPKFDKNARGVVAGGRAYLVANNIPKGRARSIFLHEVGSHLGIQRLLSDAQFDKLVDSVVKWAGKQDGSIESRVAIKALGRVFTANPTDNQRNTELVAYFLEEAINMGVDPTAMSYKTEFGRWFRAVYAAMKAAIRKLGFNPDKLTAQDMVDMAYGAARLEISGSWHGTAAKFRKFNHTFMNSGEGAQAFGWGTYVAQKFGIATGYRERDVKAKKTDALSAYAGWALAKDIVNPDTQQVVFEAGRTPDFVGRRDITRLHEKLGVDEVSFTKDGKTETVSLGELNGSLFRTDANIAEDEYLDYDETYLDQSERVKEAVLRVREEIGPDNFERHLDDLNLYLQDMTGKDFYELLKRASQADEIPSNNKDVLEAQQRGQDDRAASMYLDELGIKGLKFLDNPSRDAAQLAKDIERTQRRIDSASKGLDMFTSGLAERRQAIKEYQSKEPSTQRDEAIASITSTIESYSAIVAQHEEKLARNKEHLDMLLERQKEAGSITRNSVIFNDKNIQRVATARGGDLDDMQFSTGGSPAQSKAQVAAQNKKIERNVNRLPAKVRPWATANAKLANRVRNYFSFTGDIVDRAEKLLPSASKYLKAMREGVAVRAAARDVVEKITRKYEALPKAEQTAVNKLLKESTTSKKWAFKPSWMAGAEVDPALAEKYDALSPEAATVVREVFAHGYNTMAAMKRGVRATIDSEYAANIAVAQKLVDMRTKERDAKPGEKREKALEKAKKQLAKLQAAQTASVSEYSKLIDTNMNSPYAPLRRTGDHVVVMRSAEYSAAEDILEKAEDYTPQEVKAAKDFIEDNRTKKAHYQVHFFESSLDAEKKAAELGETGTVQQFKKSRLAEEVFGSTDMSGVIYRVRKQANDLDGVDTNVNKRALNNLLTQLHIQLLSEKSARHSEQQRKNIEGADENMMRSFYTHGIASASFLSGLHKTKEITDALDAMQRESRDRSATNRSERTDAYNEIAARHQLGMETRDTPITDRTLKYSSAYMLLTKPLYYVQNAVQPWAVSLPVLMGKFGRDAPGAMLKAYREVSPLLATTRLTADTIGKLPKDEQKLVQDLMTSGRLNFDLDQDMGDRLKGNNPVDGAIAKLQGVAERVETINRVTTAIAAYRLEFARSKNHDAATNYAGKIVYDTHGDYSGFEAPRIMRSNVGRIATQFRKFQMIQISLLAKLTNQAFKSADPDERAAGKKALAYTLATTFTLGGTMALPGYTAIAWILGKAFGDDDEPDDPEAQEARMRKAIGDPFWADLLLKGAGKAITGVDTSPIFGGWGNMLSLLPYTKVEDMSRSTATNILMSLAGPAVGQSVKLFEGVGKMAEGDMPGALQKVLPTGFANVVKAYELAENGVRRPNGAAILGPDEIGMLDVMGQALGLKTGTVGEKEFINRVTTTYEAYYRDEGQKVSAEYVKAYAKGDKATMEQARERWKELNDSRRENGFKVRPMSELFKAPQAARKNEQRVNRTLNKTTQQFGLAR